MSVLFYEWCCQTDKLIVVIINGVSKLRHEYMTSKLPNWVKCMQIAGMADVVKIHTKTTSKVNPRGKMYMCACYAADHIKQREQNTHALRLHFG